MQVTDRPSYTLHRHSVSPRYLFSFGFIPLPLHTVFPTPCLVSSGCVFLRYTPYFLLLTSFPLVASSSATLPISYSLPRFLWLRLPPLHSLFLAPTLHRNLIPTAFTTIYSLRKIVKILTLKHLPPFF